MKSIDSRWKVLKASAPFLPQPENKKHLLQHHVKIINLKTFSPKGVFTSLKFLKFRGCPTYKEFVFQKFSLPGKALELKAHLPTKTRTSHWSRGMQWKADAPRMKYNVTNTTGRKSLHFCPWATVGQWGHQTSSYAISLKQFILWDVMERELGKKECFPSPACLQSSRAIHSQHGQWLPKWTGTSYLQAGWCL